MRKVKSLNVKANSKTSAKAGFSAQNKGLWRAKIGPSAKRRKVTAAANKPATGAISLGPKPNPLTPL